MNGYILFGSKDNVLAISSTGGEKEARQMARTFIDKNLTRLVTIYLLAHPDPITVS
jgi:hypothetical protein